MIARSSLFVGILIVGCSSPRPPAAPANGQPMASDDTRRALAGEWQVSFYVDSVRKGPGPAGLGAGSGQAAVGTLRLFDTIAEGRAGAVSSRLKIDFAPALGRTMSCAPPEEGSVGVSREGDTVDIRFTPNAADCGFSARGTLSGDSVTGTWSESSFVGAAALGRFRMVRTGN